MFRQNIFKSTLSWNYTAIPIIVTKIIIPDFNDVEELYLLPNAWLYLHRGHGYLWNFT